MKAISTIKYTFTLAGMGLLAGAFFMYSNTSTFLENAAQAEGLVVDLVQSRSSNSTTYAPAITFVSQKGDTVEFVSSLSSNPPSYSIGEKVKVLYLPANPHDAKIDGFFSLWFGFLVVGGLGAVFFVVGAGIVIMPMLRARSEEHLLKHGIPIETELQGVEVNTSYSVNGRHPYVVMTQWQNPATSEIHVFQSGNLWYDPAGHIKKTDRIRVFVDQNNPKKYVVDLSFLPKMAG